MFESLTDNNQRSKSLQEKLHRNSGSSKSLEKTYFVQHTGPDSKKDLRKRIQEMELMNSNLGILLEQRRVIDL